MAADMSQSSRELFTRDSFISRLSHDVNPFPSLPNPSWIHAHRASTRAWARTLLHAFSRDPTKYPRHTVGVSFRDINVFGSSRTAGYQRDVYNSLWGVPMMMRSWLVSQHSNIPILEDFDGLVRAGEMLLVLGRPGRRVHALGCDSALVTNAHINASGVSTLLKTISGQTHGLVLSREVPV